MKNVKYELSRQADPFNIFTISKIHGSSICHTGSSGGEVHEFFLRISNEDPLRGSFVVGEGLPKKLSVVSIAPLRLGLRDARLQWK